MGFADRSVTLDQLADAGVRRVSIGGALARLAMRAFLEGARQMHGGDFRFVAHIANVGDLLQAFD